MTAKGGSTSLPSGKLFAICISIAFGFSFHIAYLMYAVNPSTPAFQTFINGSHHAHYGRYLSQDAFRIIWSLITTSMNFGGIFGCLLTPSLFEGLGRRRTFFVISACQSTTAILTACAGYVNAYEMLAVVRFLSGVVAAMPICLQPVFFSEIAPKTSRGVLNGLTATMSYLGAVVGAVVALPSLLGSVDLWPYLFLLQLVPLSIGTTVVSLCPESPKFLLASGHDDAAKRSIRFYHGAKADVDCAVKAMQMELDATRNETHSLRTIWRDRSLRGKVLLGVALNVGSGYSGSYAIAYFATSLLADSGFTDGAAATANVGVAIAVFAGTIVSTAVVDRVGRRPLVIVGCVSTAAVSSVMMVTLLMGKRSATPYIIAVCACAIVFLGGVGIVQVSVYIASELVPQRSRSLAQSCAMVARYVGQSSSAFIFFPLHGWVGAYSFVEFIVPMTAIALLAFFYLPETKGRDAHELRPTNNRAKDKCEGKVDAYHSGDVPDVKGDDADVNTRLT